jgi:hypothetical protein
MEPWLEDLSEDLFWDVQISQVDCIKHRRWLVERVLTRGRLEDWRLLTLHVSRRDLRELLTRLRLPPRERFFLKMHTGCKDA